MRPISLPSRRSPMAPARSPLFAPTASIAAFAAVITAGAFLFLPSPAQAHHLLDLTGLPPTPLHGLLSGLAHPVIGPDHLLFLLALSLVGLRHRAGWMLALLGCGLAGSVLGLLLPGAPIAEPLVAFSLVVVGMVLLDRWPRALLLPAFATHGYVLSAAVIGWNRMPLLAYLLGLLVSQGLLLLVSLLLLRQLGEAGFSRRRLPLAAGLIGVGLAWTWSGVVG